MEARPRETERLVAISPTGRHVCFYDVLADEVVLLDIASQQEVWRREFADTRRLAFSESEESIVALQFGFSMKRSL